MTTHQQLLDQVNKCRLEIKHLQLMLETRAHEWQMMNGHNRARSLIKKARWLNLNIFTFKEVEASINNAERE